MEEILAATICMTSRDDRESNLEEAEYWVRKAARHGAQWIMLPEMVSYMGPYERLPQVAEAEDGPMNRRFAGWAKELGIVLFAGTVAERPDGEAASDNTKVYNTQYVFGPDGRLLQKYRKTHLFNLINDDGNPIYCESDGYLPGDRLVSVDCAGFRLGLSICYDLRFSEFYNQLQKQGPIDVMAVPSAFTEATGKDHWEVLLRARAIEYQCYVLAANQTGTHGPGKSSYGHSMIIDPWGHKVCDTGDLPGIGFGLLEKSKIKRYRARVPALKNRRPELYS